MAAAWWYALPPLVCLLKLPSPRRFILFTNQVPVPRQRRVRRPARGKHGGPHLPQPRGSAGQPRPGRHLPDHPGHLRSDGDERLGDCRSVHLFFNFMLHLSVSRVLACSVRGFLLSLFHSLVRSLSFRALSHFPLCPAVSSSALTPSDPLPPVVI